MAGNNSAGFKESNQLLALNATVQQPPCSQGRTHVLPKPIVTKFSPIYTWIWKDTLMFFKIQKIFCICPLLKLLFWMELEIENVLLHVADTKKLRWHCIGQSCRLIGATWQPPDRHVGVMTCAFSGVTIPSFFLTEELNLNLNLQSSYSRKVFDVSFSKVTTPFHPWDYVLILYWFSKEFCTVCYPLYSPLATPPELHLCTKYSSSRISNPLGQYDK